MEFLDQVAFIDIGAYDGDSLQRYVVKGGDVREAHLFEPNPHVHLAHEFDFPLTVYRAAAWTKNEKRALYLSRQYEMLGSTLFPEKTTGDLDRERPLTVDCIDFPAWLAELHARPLVLKLNAEGVEYPLIEALAEAQQLEHFSVIYVSLHADKIGLAETADTRLRVLLQTACFHPIKSVVYSAQYFEAWQQDAV